MDTVPTPVISIASSKKQKVWRWTKENSPQLIGITASLSAIGLYVWAVVASAKEQNEMVKEYNNRAHKVNNWINDEQNAGNHVWYLADGRFLKVEGDVKAETVII